MRYIFFLLFSLLCLTTYGQNIPIDKTKKGFKLPAKIIDGDTIATINLSQVNIVSDMVFKNQRQKEKWDRLKYNVSVTYPLACIASQKLYQYECDLKKISNAKDREKYLKSAEYELKKDFEGHIRELTFSQGVILIKLIDRQTGNTSYNLVKKLKGNFSAFMWQGVAKVFGSNLKSEYDPYGEDRLIELAVLQIQN
jgi:hypothetical protein